MPCCPRHRHSSEGAVIVGAGHARDDFAEHALFAAMGLGVPLRLPIA
jgi:hypothetical protein